MGRSFTKECVYNKYYQCKVNIIIENIITIVNVFMRKITTLQMAQGPKHIAVASQNNK